MVHYWKKEDADSLLDILDSLTGDGITYCPEFFDVVLGEVRAAGHEVTKTQLMNKIRGLARTSQMTKTAMLLDWEHQGPRLRELPRANNGAVQRSQRASTDYAASSPDIQATKRIKFNISSSTESVSQDDDDDATCASQLTFPTPPQQDQPFRSLRGNRSPTISSITDASIPNGTDPHNTTGRAAFSETGPVLMEVDPWEQRLLSYFRVYRERNVYDEPPAHEYIKNEMEQLGQRVEKAVKRFLIIHPTATMTTSRLIESCMELSQLLVRDEHGVGLESCLNTLFAEPGMTPEIVLQVYAGAAVYTWIGVSEIFEESTDANPSPACCELASMCGKFNHTILRKLKISKHLGHLETVVKPSLPVRARELRKRLFALFDSLCVSPAKTTTPEANKSLGYQHRLKQQVEWERLVDRALLDLLNLRLTLAKSSLRYLWTFPKVGDKFKEKSMESEDARSEPTTTTPRQDSTVYVCLSPSITSFERKDKSLPVVVVPARVILEDFVAAEVMASRLVRNRHVQMSGDGTLGTLEGSEANGDTSERTARSQSLEASQAGLR